MMPGPCKEVCECCYYWVRWRSAHKDDDPYKCGHCHRFPPTVNPKDQDQFSIRLSTHQVDWCGEFRPKPGPTA
jgi:hypothetical protein